MFIKTYVNNDSERYIIDETNIKYIYNSEEQKFTTKCFLCNDCIFSVYVENEDELEDDAKLDVSIECECLDFYKYEDRDDDYFLFSSEQQKSHFYYFPNTNTFEFWCGMYKLSNCKINNN